MEIDSQSAADETKCSRVTDAGNNPNNVIDGEFEVLFATTAAPFVHVTPRHNVDRHVNNNNFYDVVAVQRTTRLKPFQVFQLSRKGLLFTEGPHSAVLVPLSEILEGKTQLLALRNLVFFGMFKETKCFSAWRSLTRKYRVQRSRNALKITAAFASAPLVKASLLISEELYKLETDVELYDFVGYGAINCCEYFEAQSAKLIQMVDFIASRLERISVAVISQYSALFGNDSLSRDIEEVKSHHPYAAAENAGFPVDWVNLRAVQRVSDESRRHLGRLLLRAQFMLEGVIGQVLVSFWKRVLYGLQGIRFATIRKVRRKGGKEPELPAAEGKSAIAVWSLADAERMLTKLQITGADEQGAPMKVTRSWEEEGFHLRVDLNIFLRGIRVEPAILADSQDITGLKIRVVPSKSDLMSSLYDLYRSLGILLESVPDFRRLGNDACSTSTSFATTRYKKGTRDASTMSHVSSGTVEGFTEGTDPALSMGSSSAYFAYVQSHSILRSAGALTYATSCLSAFAAAYEEACSCGELMMNLEDTFRRLWAINPRGLATQMETSMVLCKLKIVMNTPDFVDDISRTMESEKKRFALLRRSVDHLREAQQLLMHFADLKQPLGLVTSFQIVNMQVVEFRSIQHERLYGTMPKTFLTRCGEFVAYAKVIENFFELNSPDLDGLMSLMRALRSFDDAKDLFDLEVEIVDEIFGMLEEHVLVDHIDGSRNLQLSPADVGQIRTLHKLYKDAKMRLFNAVSRSRSLLLGQLPLISNDTKARRRGLHIRIARESEVLMQPMFYEKNSSTVSCISALEEAEKSMVALRDDVAQMVRIQAILVAGHDLIGVAEPVLNENDVDSFADMAELEMLYADRSKAWMSVVQINAMKRRLLSCRVSGCDIPASIRQLDEFKANHQYLINRIEEEGVLEQLAASIAEVEPKLSIVACLSSQFLRPHHWQWLSDFVLRYCGLSVKFAGQSSEIVKLLDMNVPLGNEPVGMGEFHRFPVNDLLYRGVESHLASVQNVTTDAAVEYTIESMLEKMGYVLRSLKASVRSSKEGPLPLIVENLPHVGVLSLYSNKVLQLLDAISSDLCIATFRSSIGRAREIYAVLGSFVSDIYIIQTVIGKLNSFVRHSHPSEVSGELVADFNSCVEGFRKIGQAFQQKSMHMWATCESLSEYDVSTEATKSVLQSLLEDFHSNIQSYVDACPRLSLLPYNRLVALASVWLGGASEHVSMVNECMQVLFEGVGSLLLAPVATTDSSLTSLQVAYACIGCVSVDKSEEIEFVEEIPLSASLFDFIRHFEIQLRSAVAKPCDFLLLHRVQSLRTILTDSSAAQIVTQLSRIFALRAAADQLAESERRSHPNYAVVLSTAASFSEDVWTCLGHPMGSLVLARPDLKTVSASASFQKEWRASLELLLKNCKDIIVRMQKAVRQTELHNLLSRQKIRALAVSLLLQEIELMRIVEVLLACISVEEAEELWSNAYQLCTVYDINERVRMSPFEVSLGGITVPFGLEYPGGHVCVVPRGEVLRALSHVVSASSCKKVSVFTSSLRLGCNRRGVSAMRDSAQGGRASESLLTNEELLMQSDGELAVAAKDISNALGRICTSLTTVTSAVSVRLFLSRIVYMDAVGVVEFSLINQRGLDIFTNVLTVFFAALEKKQDVFIQDGLKFSFPTRFSRKETQLQRRKDNLSFLRHHLNNLTKLNRDIGLPLIGMLSEDQVAESRVFKSIVRDAMFSVKPVETAVPASALGVMMTAAGFEFGIEIQNIYYSTLEVLRQKYAAFIDIIRALSSSLTIRGIIRQASEALAITNLVMNVKAPVDTPSGFWTTSSSSFWHMSAAIPEDSGQGSAKRLRMEIELFTSSLWESTLLISVGLPLLNSAAWDSFRRDLFGFFEQELDAVFESSIVSAKVLSGGQEPRQQRGEGVVGARAAHTQLAASVVLATPLDLMVGDKLLMLSRAAKHLIRTSSFSLGYSPGIQFVQQCAHLWGSICEPTNTVFVLSGPLACGKTSLLRTVFHIIECSGTDPGLLIHANSRCMSTWRAATTIKRAFVTWLKSPRRRLQVEEKSTKDMTANKGGARAVHVHATVIHHTSLPGMYLLGNFDTNGTWMDGVLMRAVRRAETSSGGPGKHLHVIILDGPCGPFIEQLFSSNYQSPSRPIYFHSRSMGTVTMPTGECDLLASNIKIVLESSDLSHASPSMVSQTPLLHVDTDSDTCVQRLLAVWYKSLCHWLDHFPPWTEVVSEVGRWLVDSRLVHSCLYHDIGPQQMPVAVAVSRVGTFLRCFEELLVQCHELVILESVVIDPGALGGAKATGKAEVAGHDTITADERMPSGTCPDLTTKHSQVMALGPKGRSKLMKRVQLSVGFAVVWGFGGSGNSSDKRRLFDSIVRDSLHLYVSRASEIIMPEDYSVFEVVVNLERISMDHAAGASVRGAVKSALGVPDRYHDLHVVAELPSAGNLEFHTPSTRSVALALGLIQAAGANPLLLGRRGCGKTITISRMLQQRSKNVPSTPAGVRMDTLKNLIRIIADYEAKAKRDRDHSAKTDEEVHEHKKGGKGETSAALDACMSALKQLEYLTRTTVAGGDTDSSMCDVQACWQTVRDACKGLSSSSLRADCQEGTIFTASTTARGWRSATPLRQWLERTLRSDMAGVLESPRLGQGLLFIDDLHMSGEDDADTGSVTSKVPSDGDFDRRIENQAHALFKGILCGTPTFGLRRNLCARDGSAATSGGKQLEREVGAAPVFHRLLLSDPTSRIPSQCPANEGFASALPSLAGAMGDYDSNHIMQRLGFVGAATMNGEFSDIVKMSYRRGAETSDGSGDGRNCTVQPRPPSQPLFMQLLHHFSVISMPSLSSTEVHVALIAGVSAMLHSEPSSSASNLVSILQNEIAELCTITLRLVSKFRKNFSTDAGLSGDVEDTMSRLINLDVASVYRFCLPFRLASKSINNPGALLHCFAHEWRSSFVSCIPPGRGLRRDKMLHILQRELESLEPERYCVTTEWLKALVASTSDSAHGDSSKELWTDVHALRGVRNFNPPDKPESNVGRRQAGLPSDATQVADRGTHGLLKEVSFFDREARRGKRKASNLSSRQLNPDADDSKLRNRSTSRSTSRQLVQGLTDQLDKNDSGGDSISTGTYDGESESDVESETGDVEAASAGIPKSHSVAGIDGADRNERRLQRSTYVPLTSNFRLEYDSDGHRENNGACGGDDDRAVSEMAVASSHAALHVSLDDIKCSGRSLPALHPAALSTILRLVRILRCLDCDSGKSTGRHILLAGATAAGTSRPLAVALTAKLCGLIFAEFDVKRAVSPCDPSAYSASASSRFESYDWISAVRTSLSIRSFLKSIVLRAAGFIQILETIEVEKQVVPAAYKKEPPQTTSKSVPAVPSAPSAPQASSVAGQRSRNGGVSYAFTSPVSILAYVHGAQEIWSESERSDLLRVIDNSDITSLFDNFEVLAMAAALRDEAVRSEKAKQVLLDTLAGHHQNRNQTAATMDDAGSDKTSADRKKAPVSEAGNDDKFGGRNVPGIAGGGVSRALIQFMSTADAPTGHVARWIGDVLREAVSLRVIVVLDIDIHQALNLKENVCTGRGVSTGDIDEGDDDINGDDYGYDAVASSGQSRVPNWKREGTRSSKNAGGHHKLLVRRAPWRAAKLGPSIDANVVDGGSAGRAPAFGYAINPGYQHYTSSLFACSIIGPAIVSSFNVVLWIAPMVHHQVVLKDVCDITITTKKWEISRTIRVPDGGSEESPLVLQRAHLGSASLTFLPRSPGMFQDPLEILLKRESSLSTSAGARERRDEASARSEALQRLAEREKIASESASSDVGIGFRLTFDFDQRRPSLYQFTDILSQVGVVATQRQMLARETTRTGADEMSAGISTNAAGSTASATAAFLFTDSATSETGSQTQRAIAGAVLLLLEEAREVLPVLLSLPADCDAVFMNEAVDAGAQGGAEKGAELASIVVAKLVSEGGSAMLQRFAVLSDVLQIVDESIMALSQYEATKLSLIQRNEEIVDGLKATCRSIASLSSEIDAVRRGMQELYGWDHYQMTMEDSLSMRSGCKHIERRLQEAITLHTARFAAVDQDSWHSMASMFSPRQGVAIPPPRDLVELMRVVIGITDYPLFNPAGKTAAKSDGSSKKAPKKSKRKKDDGSARGDPYTGHTWSSCDPDCIIKTSKALFNSGKVAMLLGTVPVRALDPLQTYAILDLTTMPHQAVAMQRTNVAAATFMPDAHRGSAAKEKAPLKLIAEAAAIAAMPLVPGSLVDSNTMDDEIEPVVAMTTREKEILQLVDMIRGYIFMLKVHIDVSKLLAHTCHGADGIAKQAASTIVERKEAMEGALRRLDTCRSQQQHNMELLEAQLSRNKRKLDGLNRMQECSSKSRQALTGFRSYLIAELALLKSVMATFVCDCCVAAAVLGRASWLPDKLRVDCTSHLRRHLLSRGYSVTNADSPFALGSLMDRQQVRQWTVGQQHCSRDPSTINCMGLAMLSPLFTFVYDPDGTSETQLSEGSPDGYELCSVSAHRFSLSQLEGWVEIAKDHQASGSDAAAICLIISDIQAGLSQDLVSLLSADLDVQPRSPHHTQQHHEVGIASEGGHVDGPYELVARLLKPQGNTDAGYPEGAARDSLTRHSLLLCRLRVYLLSTRMQATDLQSGLSAPLPTSCMKNVSAVLHWTVAVQPSVVVDPALLDVRSLDNHTADSHQLLASRMGHALFGKINGQDPDLPSLNERILGNTSALYKAECHLVNLVHRFSSSEEIRENRKSFVVTSPEGVEEETAVVDGDAVNISHAALGVGFAPVERIRKCLLATHADRLSLSRAVADLKQAERDGLAYLAAGCSTFGAALLMLRMGAAVIPPSDIPVYSLTPRAICARFVSSSLDKAEKSGLLSRIRIPDSIASMSSVSRGISAAQKLWRNLRSKTSSLPSQSKIRGGRNKVGMSSFASPVIAEIEEKEVEEEDEDRAGDAGRPTMLSRAAQVAQRRVLPSERMRSFHELQTLLGPLRSFFASEALGFLRLIVRPGCEWLPKFGALIVSWPDSAVNSLQIPGDELRILFSAIRGGTGAPVQRFSSVAPNLRSLPLPRRKGGIDDVFNIVSPPATRTDGSFSPSSIPRRPSVLTAWLSHGWGPLDGLWLPSTRLPAFNAHQTIRHFPTFCDDTSTQPVENHTVQSEEPVAVDDRSSPPTRPMFADLLETELLVMSGVKVFATVNVPFDQILASTRVFSQSCHPIHDELPAPAVYPTEAGSGSTGSTDTRYECALESTGATEASIDERRIEAVIRSAVVKQHRQGNALYSTVGPTSQPIIAKADCVPIVGSDKGAGIRVSPAVGRFVITQGQRKNLKVLESHSALSGTFKGLEAWLQSDDNNRIFAAWQQALQASRRICFTHLSEEKLFSTARTLAAPSLQAAVTVDLDDSEAKPTPGACVLSVVQTMILAEALFPGENLSSTLVDAVSALLAHVVRLRSAGGTTRGPELNKAHAMPRDANQVIAARLFEINFNSWSQLLSRRMSGGGRGRGDGNVSGIGGANDPSRSSASLWGGLLLRALSPEPAPVSKYATMKTLHDTIANPFGRGFAILVADDEESLSFYQGLRPLGNRIGRAVQVVKCHWPPVDTFDKSSQDHGERAASTEAAVVQLVKTIRAATSTAKKAQQVYLDMLDLLHSPLANLLFSSGVLSHASGSGGSIVIKSTTAMDAKYVASALAGGAQSATSGEWVDEDEDDKPHRHRSSQHATKSFARRPAPVEWAQYSGPGVRGAIPTAITFATTTEKPDIAANSIGGGTGTSTTAESRPTAQIVVTVPCQVPSPSLVSTARSQATCGFAPLLVFAELIPIWMPRLHMGDIVQMAMLAKEDQHKAATKHTKRPMPTLQGPIPPPLFFESSDLLCHLLDSQLYSLLNVLTSLSSTQLRAPQFDIIRHASKEEVRVMSGILAIRQLFLLEGCSALERSRPTGPNVCWLATLEPMGAWEVVRILANVKDILSAGSSAPDADEKLLVAIRNCVFYLQCTTFADAAGGATDFYGSMESRKLRKQNQTATIARADVRGDSYVTGAGHQQGETEGSHPDRTMTITQTPRTPSRPTVPPPSKPGFRDISGGGGRGKYSLAHEFAVSFRKTMNAMRAVERFGIGPVAHRATSLMQSIFTSYLYGLLKRLGKNSSRSTEKSLNAMKVAGIVRTAQDDLSLVHGGVGVFTWTEVVRGLVAWTVDVQLTTNESTKPEERNIDLDVARLKWKKGIRKLLIVSRFLSRRKTTAKT